MQSLLTETFLEILPASQVFDFGLEAVGLLLQILQVEPKIVLLLRELEVRLIYAE